MNNVKQKTNGFLSTMKELWYILSISCVVVVIITIIAEQQEYHNKKPQQTNIIAYNELSSHIVGSSNYTNNPSLKWHQIVPLERQDIYRVSNNRLDNYKRVLLLKQLYYEGVKSITISYKDINDPIEKKILNTYNEPFQFAENGEDSVIEEDSLTVERYNLVAVK